MNIVLGVGVGFVVGLLGGILGIGGGALLVPALVLLLGVEQHSAQGISLGAITVIAIVGTITHYRQKMVRLHVVLWAAPAAIVLGIAGASLAGAVDALWLRRFFAVLLLLMGIQMLLSKSEGEIVTAD